MEPPKADFDLEQALRAILSDGKESPPIFDRLLERFESFSDRPVSSLGDLKRRDNKRLKGLAWEKFCCFYLSQVMKFEQVWLWSDIPEQIRTGLKLGSRVDNGIDIVACGWSGPRIRRCSMQVPKEDHPNCDLDYPFYFHWPLCSDWTMAKTDRHDQLQRSLEKNRHPSNGQRPNHRLWYFQKSFSYSMHHHFSGPPTDRTSKGRSEESLKSGGAESGSPG